MSDSEGAGRPGRSALRFLREALLVLGGAVLIAFVLKSLIAQAFFIPSESMRPQLEVSDRVLVSKLSYRLHDPRRGDIVVFDCPPSRCGQGGDDGSGVSGLIRSLGRALGLAQPSSQELIKRVVGLPGETVEARGGQVYVDGRRLVEPYLPPGTATSALAPTRVPEGAVFVLGDNRSFSTDSRVFGPVRRSSVVGRAIGTVWPPGRAAFL
ncbi:MAG: signal peptidase I [Actinomycetota bacterium]|nr:signal peptidase I [Actinomycetota bacterium]